MLKPEYASIINSFSEGNHSLEKKSHQYWELMRCWNGVETSAANSNMTIEKAFTQINAIQEELNPQRPLYVGLNTLRGVIVEFGSKARHAKHMKKQAPKLARITIL